MQIQHIGKIVGLTSSAVIVAIDNMSECNGCTARLLCNRDSTKGLLTIRINNPADFVIGESVRISATNSLQDKAVRIGIVYPCLLLLATATVCTLTGISQTITALAAVGSAAIYYGILYLFSRKINEIFRWTVHKLH